MTLKPLPSRSFRSLIFGEQRSFLLGLLLCLFLSNTLFIHTVHSKEKTAEKTTLSGQPSQAGPKKEGKSKMSKEFKEFKELKQEVFYVCYGNFEEDTLEALTKLDSNDLPTWAKVRVLRSKEELSNVKSILETPEAPEILGSNAAMKELVTKTLNAKNAILISGETLNSNQRKALDDFTSITSVVGVLGCADEAISIFDLRTFTLEKSDSWAKKRYAREELTAESEITIDAIKEGDNELWLLTKGMIKFGQPELCMHHVKEKDYKKALANLNNLASVAILSKDSAAIFSKDNQFKHNTTIRTEEYPKGLHVSHKGSYEDEDYWGNVHVELKVVE